MKHLKWMISFTTWSILMIGNPLNGDSQQFFHQVKLPGLINESSAVETGAEGTIWTFNDSGGKPEIYQLDTLGNLLRTIEITNAWNRDWEDITRDDQGNLYIGNIGNNSNKNRDLCIFKIQNPDSLKDDNIEAQIIRYQYEDQMDFPPADFERNFDAEALMWYNGHLYITTKNRTKPFSGVTKLYRLPAQPGEYSAKFISQFVTGKGDRFNFWITAGDISLDGSKLVLLSSDRFWIFWDFKGDDFYGGKSKMIMLPSNTQKEGVAFMDENTLVITDEEWFSNVNRNLYLLKMDNL